MTLYKIVEIRLKAPYNLWTLNFHLIQDCLSLHVIKSNEFVSPLFLVFNSSENDESFSSIFLAKIMDVGSLILVSIDLAFFVASKKTLYKENLRMFDSFG